MKRIWVSIGFALAAAVLAAAPEPAPAAPTEPKAAEPKPAFYEKYLTDEDPLDRAIRDLTQKVGEKPDDVALHNDLANLLARRGFAKESLEHYRAAEKLDRHAYLPPYNEGLLWEKEGQPGRAMSAFRRSIHLKPGFPFSHFHLGVLEEKQGRVAAAVTEYAKALRIDNSLRLPSRNPLAVQSRLLYRASVANYDRDLAAGVLVADGEFLDPGVLARISPERFVDASQVAAPEQESPEAAPGPATVVTVPRSVPGGGGPRQTPAAPRGRGRVGAGRQSRRYSPQAVPAPVEPVAPPPVPAAEPAPPPEEQPVEVPPPAEEEPPPPPVFPR